MNKNLSKTIKATLYRIGSSSPKHIRTAEVIWSDGYGGDKSYRPKSIVADWETPEAAVVWAIYERAVFDYFGIGTGSHGFGTNPVYRNETAETGLITLSTGKRMNILELLGIDPTWAWAQVKRAVDYTVLKEAA